MDHCCNEKNAEGALNGLSELLSRQIISRNSAYFLRQAVERGRVDMIECLCCNMEVKTSIPDDIVQVLRQVHAVIEVEAQGVFDSLFAETPYEVGKELANNDILQFETGTPQALLYGEIEFSSFFKILRKFRPTNGGKFYDLGSGTGKAVLAARLVCDFDCCIGIELLESLHSQAVEVNGNYSQHYSDKFGGTSFYLDSIVDADWSDGDFVFANSTNFDLGLMQTLSEKAELLKPGSIIVTFTKPVVSSKIELLEEMKGKMSWGRATIYIHRRRSDDSTSGGDPLPIYSFPEDSFTYTDKDARLLCQYLLYRRDQKLKMREPKHDAKQSARTTTTAEEESDSENAAKNQKG